MQSINLKFNGSQLADFYRPLVENFMKSIFPLAIRPCDDIAEFILREIIGSREVRQGAQPGIESQAEMMKIIRANVQAGQAIPILIGSGPKKTKSGESIDIAEVSTLRILYCLNEAVKVFHKPGLDIVIRLEDLTGYHLELTDERESITRYIGEFQKLIRILGYDEFIRPLAESDFINEPEFMETCKKLTPMFQEFLIQSDYLPEEAKTSLASYQALVALGWKGVVPSVMREHLIERYARSYPGRIRAQYMVMMAKYFAATLARHIHNATGNIWNRPHLQLSYVAAIPGLPEGLHSTRVYYRTASLKQTKTHIPYWRAKGFLKISEDNSVKIGLTNWHDVPAELESAEIEFYNDNESVNVKADFMLVD